MKLQTCTSTGTPKTPKHITLQARRLAVPSGPTNTEVASIPSLEHDALRCARTTTFAKFSARLLPGWGNNILRNQTALRGALTAASSVRTSLSGCNNRINEANRKPPSLTPSTFCNLEGPHKSRGTPKSPRPLQTRPITDVCICQAATSTAASAPQRRDASDTSPCELARTAPLQFN
jgi:hypothetical protein